MADDDALVTRARLALIEALADLHVRAGRPTFRQIADGTKQHHSAKPQVSYETVRKMLNGSEVPTWKKWPPVVQALLAMDKSQAKDHDSEELRFQEMWIACQGSSALVEDDDPSGPRYMDAADVELYVERRLAEREAEIARRRNEEVETEIARRWNYEVETAAEPAVVLTSAGSSLRPHMGAVSIFAGIGTLVGGLVGCLVGSLLGAVKPLHMGPILGVVIGPVVGLIVGMFVGAATANIGRGGRGVVGDRFVGLIGAGGLVGLFAGTFVGTQTSVARSGLLMGCIGGLVSGLLIGMIVLGALHLRPALSQGDNFDDDKAA